MRVVKKFRHVVAAALFVLLAAPAVASAQGVGVGVKGGLLYSSFKFNDIEDVIDSRAGWMAGLFFGGNRPGAVGVMGEINLLSKRGEVNGETVHVNYLQVPVLARANFGNDDAAGYIIVGPNFDVKIGEQTSVTLFDEYEGFDVGLTAGAGAEFGALIIEGRGTWGLRNIAKDFAASDLKTRSFALLAGIRFN